MSARRPIEDLVHELAGDVAPVRSIASLSVAAASALLFWAAILIACWVLGAPLPIANWEVHLGDPARVGVLLGMALVGGGALAAALASAVPGRASVVRTGAIVACVGAVVGIGAGAVGAMTGESGPETMRIHVACTLRALVLSLAPVYVAVAYLRRGAAHRGRVAAGLAAVAAVGLGAFGVHLCCPHLGSVHVFLGHCAGPTVVAALMTAPLAWWIRRRQNG